MSGAFFLWNIGMSETQKGLLAMVATSVIWGLSTLFYKALAHVPPFEVLAHRTVWSLVFFGIVLAVRGRLGELAAIFRKPRLLAMVSLAAMMVSMNWGLFIWAIQAGRTIEASLGYYIYPIMSVLLGAVLFKEKLGRVQMFAVGVIAFAVMLLTWGLGVAPWVSLMLMASFVTYGLIKKLIPMGPVASVTGEVLLLSPLALVWLWGVHTQGWTGMDDRNVAAFGMGWYNTIMLMLLGLLTAGPLILYSYATKRLGFATQGLVFYLNPTLQFLVAVLAFGEPVSRWHAIAFPMIWAALAIYTLNALRQERAVASPLTVFTTVK